MEPFKGFRAFLRFQGHFEAFQKRIKRVSGMFKEFFRNLSIVFQRNSGAFQMDNGIFEGISMGLLRFQGSSKAFQ